MPSILRTLLSAASVMLVLAACSGEPLAALPSEAGLEPLATGARAGQPVPDRYIVVFREGVTNGRALAAQMVQAAGGQLHFSYEHALNGFAATLPPQAIDGITRNPHVAYVETRQRGDDRANHAEQRHVGARPHRSAGTTVGHEVHLHPNG